MGNNICNYPETHPGKLYNDKPITCNLPVRGDGWYCHGHDALGFIETLSHTKGKWSGHKFSTLDWQYRAITDIFGTLRENGFRQYTTAYLEICKKQGKSELGAAVALYCLMADQEWSGEVYGCASDRQQASIVFDVAVDMVDQHEEYRKIIKPILSQKRLVYPAKKSYYQVLSADAYSKHGFNVSAVIFDEIHAQPNRGLYDVMTEGSGDARQQPLYFIITTAGDDPDRESIGWELHSMAQDILTGAKIDPTFYAMIYGIDKDHKRIWTGREYETVEGDIDWEDPKIWKKVNPSIDHTVEMEKVVDQYQRAKGNLAREKNFRWLRLNSWEKIKTSRWLSLDFWDLCKDKVDLERLHGRECYGGLDLSSKIDMTSFCLLFPPDDINKKWIVLPWFWLPEDNLSDRVEHDKVPYDQWQQQGRLNTTPGNVIDYKFIEQFILDLADKYDIREIGYDPWNAMQTAVRLEDEGLTMVEVRQGFKSMSPPMKEIEQICMGKKIIHGGHPVLRWNVGNVYVKMDENENIRPVKTKGTERIDGLVAMINAMNRAMLREEYQDAPAVITI
jgi:phage terminase large subunit-like protein